MAQLKNTTINGTLGVSSVSNLQNVNVTGNILPSTGKDASYDLGSEALRWKDVWAAKFHGALIGNVTGNVSGNVTGNVSGDVSGNAGSADKLTTENKGSATKPVYFANGVPTACSFNIDNFEASGLGKGKTITALKRTDGALTATAQDIEITSSQISDKTTSYDDPNATNATTNAAIKDALSKLETSASGDGFIYGIKQENGKLSITGPTSISTENPSGKQYLTEISVYNNGRGIKASGASFADTIDPDKPSTNNAPTCAAVKNYINTLDADLTGGDGKFVKSIRQTNGKIVATSGTLSGSVSGGNFVTSVTTSGTTIDGTTSTFTTDMINGDPSIAPTTGAVVSYINENARFKLIAHKVSYFDFTYGTPYLVVMHGGGYCSPPTGDNRWDAETVPYFYGTFLFTNVCRRYTAKGYGHTSYYAYGDLNRISVSGHTYEADTRGTLTQGSEPIISHYSIRLTCENTAGVSMSVYRLDNLEL